MNVNTKTYPMSRKDIRKITSMIKKIVDIPLDKEFPVVMFMEYFFDELKFEWEIVDDCKIKGSYAEAIPQKHLLKISCQNLRRSQKRKSKR